MTETEEENRPNPEELLARFNDEHDQEKQGKLKIFLGFSPGVGKTYSMLQAALEKREKGLDVVSGVVETHGRKETERGTEAFTFVLSIYAITSVRPD